jgi:hypothetical protein
MKKPIVKQYHCTTQLLTYAPFCDAAVSRIRYVAAPVSYIHDDQGQVSKYRARRFSSLLNFSLVTHPPPPPSFQLSYQHFPHPADVETSGNAT